MAISLAGLEYLREKRNLLAFSAGVDSSALFFLLLERDIHFDIAIVDYGLRPQSQEEVAYARSLAQKFQKKIYIEHAPLSPPGIEERARKIRYRFFEKIIKEHGYDNLVTAHQLNDQLEWFLMQMSKGAGLLELIGMDVVSKRDRYLILRPLLFTTKEELLSYLHEKNIRYFFDSSNEDENFLRNFIRKHFATPFIQHYGEGVKRSFHYLLEDRKILLKDIQIQQIKKLFLARKSPSQTQNLRIMDRIFKKLGYLLSTSQKMEILRQKEGVIAGRFAFFIGEKCIAVAPYKKIVLPKKIKELMRKHKIPKLMRGYLFAEKLNPAILQNCSKQDEKR